MAKCLRCGAGSEWLQGAVPDEPSTDVLAEAEQRGMGKAVQIADGVCGNAAKAIRAAMAQAGKGEG